MKDVISSISAILVGLALIAVGNGLLNIAIPAKAAHLGFGPFQVGFLTTFYYFGFLVGCLGTPRFVQKVGHIRSFSSFAAILCIASLSFSYSSSTFAWSFLRVLSGFSIAGIYMIAESWLNESVDNRNRGKVISIYRIVDLVSLMLGQLLLGSFSVESDTVFIFSATLINMGLIPVTLTSSQGPKPIEKIQFNFKRVFSISHIGFVTCGVIGAANASFYGLAPQFALDKGFSTQLIGVFMAAAVLAGVLFQVVLGHLADKVDREKLLSFVAFFAGCAGVLLYSVGHMSESIYLIVSLSFLWGGFAMPLYSLAIAIANDRAKASEFLELSGGLLMVFSGGAVLGPFVAPFVIKFTGISGLFCFIATVHFLLAGYVFYRRRFVVTPVPSDERTTFASPPRTTPVILEIDPRAPESIPPLSSRGNDIY